MQAITTALMATFSLSGYTLKQALWYFPLRYFSYNFTGTYSFLFKVPGFSQPIEYEYYITRGAPAILILVIAYLLFFHLKNPMTWFTITLVRSSSPFPFSVKHHQLTPSCRSCISLICLVLSEILSTIIHLTNIICGPVRPCSSANHFKDNLLMKDTSLLLSF